MDQSIRDYYNNYSKKLLKDYVLGNPRITSSINSVNRLINMNQKKILDIGCGIGWSSNEFSKNAKFVYGVDLSDKLINVAKKLFQNKNVSYEQLDVIEDSMNFDTDFDIITMLDVFEHIPKSKRKKFITSLNNILKDSGIVYLSCPSSYHQKMLRKEKPEGLQPVDEDIDIKVLYDFSSQLNKGDIIYFSYKTIWNNNDYFHAIIQKGPISYKLSRNKIKLENLRSRFRRVIELNKKHKVFSRKEISVIRKKQSNIRMESYKDIIKRLIHWN